MIDWVIGGITVLIVTCLFIGEPNAPNDNATFQIQEGQTITFDSKSDTMKFYNEADNKTFTYNSISGELLSIQEGEK